MALTGNIEINGTTLPAIVTIDKVFGGKTDGNYIAVVHVYPGETCRRAGLRIHDFNVTVPYIEGEDPVRMSYHAVKRIHRDLHADQGVVAECPELTWHFDGRPTPAIVVAAPEVVTQPEATATPVFGPHEAVEISEADLGKVIEEIEAAPVAARPGLLRRLMFWSK